MALEIKDFFRTLTSKGDQKGYFNIARSDMTTASAHYHAYLSEEGAYIIQRVTTSGTLLNKVYKYYAKSKSAGFDADWAGKSGLSYVEYYQIFSSN